MSTFTFKCPHCGIEMEAQEEWRGLETSCSGCGKTITIPNECEKDFTRVMNLFERYIKPMSPKVIWGVFGLILVLIFIIAAIVTIYSKPTFLIEKITGVRMGQRVKTQTAGHDDYFDSIHVPSQYHGKVKFEYAKMPKREVDTNFYFSAEDNWLIVYTPWVLTDKHGRVIAISISVTDQALFEQIMADMIAHGFSDGKEISGEKISLADIKLKSSGYYEFLSSDRQYKLYVQISNLPNIIEYQKKDEKIYMVTVTKKCKGEDDVPRSLVDSNGFIYNFDIASKIYIHCTSHYKGARSCLHIDGFRK